MEEIQQVPLLKKIEDLQNSINALEVKAISKPIKIPRKAKVRKGKLKKGWIGVIKIDENGNISGEKQKIEDSTLKLKEGTYHASSGEEILFWEGKFPVVVQQTWKLNALNLKKKENDSNETYGQKYVMARMLGDTIKVKAKSGSILVWALVIGAILFAINHFSGA